MIRPIPPPRPKLRLIIALGSPRCSSGEAGRATILKDYLFTDSLVNLRFGCGRWGEKPRPI